MLLKSLYSLLFIVLAPAIFCSSPTEIYNTLHSLYEDYGSIDYIGEELSQYNHALQAAHFAKKKSS